MAEASQGAETEEVTQESFLKDLYDFMKQRGTPIPPAPTLNNKPFDLWALYKHVTDRGGLENVLKERLWASIVPLIEMPTDCANPAYTLRVIYLKFLYAYERRYFLIDEEDSVIDYTPKIKHTPTVAIKPVHPINRPLLKLEYRRTPIPNESTRLRNRLKDILHIAILIYFHAMQLQKICFGLRSGSASQIQWGMEVLAMKSYEGEISLHVRDSNNNNNNDETHLGASLLSALADLARGYYSTVPVPIWKSEKAPEAPNEAHILTILRNLTLVPQNDLEIASHKAILDFLILSLSHPSPSCVEDALETLAAISYLLVLGWEGENGRNGGLNADSSRALVLKISNLLNDGFPLATLHILDNFTNQANNWPHLENVLIEASFFERLEAVLNSGEDNLSAIALKVIFNISKYGAKTKQQIGASKSIMLFLVRFLAIPRSEEELEDELVLLVVDTMYNLGTDPLTTPLLMQYESELLHIILLENPASDVVAGILSTLAP